ncbi:MAG TPA: site-specific integrase, partial [Gammaproteobacteria bacterium]|nr:site-specific integrase [Gammaproteobacteria bacterium]
VAEKKQRALEAQTGTVETLFRTYVAAIDAKRPDAVLWYAERFIFPRFGTEPWRDVRRSDVREWHAGIESAYNANRSLQALRAAFYWRLWSEDDAAGDQKKRDTRNPCAGIALRPERRRTVRLELAELPKLEQAIDDETADPYLRAYFRFVLAVGSRKTEALTLKWADVVLASETPAVVFRDTKTGDDRSIPLSRYMVALLRQLPKVAGNPYVFVGRREREPLKSPNKAWLRIRERAGLSRVRIHDLRRTFGSWLGDAGFTSKQIGSVLGHKTDITSRVYMQLGSDAQRQAVTAVEKLMSSARKPRRSKVAALRSRSRR